MNNRIQVNIDKLDMNWFIGIYDFEYEKPQRVLIDINMEVVGSNNEFFDDDYDDVVCYKTIIEDIEKLNKSGHIRLVENLGYKICDICLKYDKVLEVKVKISKVDAFANAKGVGVTIKKSK